MSVDNKIETSALSFAETAIRWARRREVKKQNRPERLAEIDHVMAEIRKDRLKAEAKIAKKKARQAAEASEAAAAAAADAQEAAKAAKAAAKAMKKAGRPSTTNLDAEPADVVAAPVLHDEVGGGVTDAADGFGDGDDVNDARDATAVGSGQVTDDSAADVTGSGVTEADAIGGESIGGESTDPDVVDEQVGNDKPAGYVAAAATGTASVDQQNPWRPRTNL